MPTRDTIRRPLRAAAVLGSAAVGLLWAQAATAEPTQPHGLTHELVPANECEYCHSFNNAPDAAEDPLYSPVFTWRGSMMANAAVDPVFWAGVAVASQDAVDPGETEACIRCHAPRAFLDGHGDIIAVDQLEPLERVGVECEVCHRMVPDAPPGNAGYTFDDTLLGGEVPRRGPWVYPADGEIPAPPHATIPDTFIASSELCGTCHDVTTERERVDADGVGLGVNFNEQRTYSEWANSALAQPGDDFRSCQDCHMPAVADAPGCRDNVNMYAHAEGARRHDLLGANRFVIELLAEDAGVFDAVAFNHSLSQLDEFVRTSATLDVEAPASVHLGEGLADLAVTVMNETGHKLPTGYSEGRIMWIEVVARLGETVVWSSGQWDAETQSLPRDPQLRTYEGHAVEHQSGESFHLLRNNRWELDTRIPPRGLIEDAETDPQTDRYPLQDDGTWAHFDEHHYVFAGDTALLDPTPESTEDDVLEVSARLLYLINTREYVEFLADENSTNDAGNELAMRFDLAGGATPVVLAEQVLSIPISGFGESQPGSTGVDESAGDTVGPGTDTTAGLPGGTAAESSTGDGGQTDGGGGGCQCRAEPRGGAWGSGAWALLLGGLWARRARRAA